MLNVHVLKRKATVIIFHTCLSKYFHLYNALFSDKIITKKMYFHVSNCTKLLRKICQQSSSRNIHFFYKIKKYLHNIEVKFELTYIIIYILAHVYDSFF